MTSPLSFCHFQYTGIDAEKFLQGQLTKNVKNLDEQHFAATAICDLKGRIQFGLWIKRGAENQFDIIISQDLADDFVAHIKKYGAFSKATLSPAIEVFPTIQQGQASFSLDKNQQVDIQLWQLTAIQHGQAWISKSTSHLFQPQELRLHQRGGVDYNKGCYIGQEIIARLWFKAQPKHWLHLIQGTGELPPPASLLAKDVQVVNSITVAQGWLALVIAKPEALSLLDIQVLALPAPLDQSVARPK